MTNQTPRSKYSTITHKQPYRWGDTVPRLDPPFSNFVPNELAS